MTFKISTRPKFISLAVLLIIVAVISAYFFFGRQASNLAPDSKFTYYKIFNKDEILDGTEDNAAAVVQKLDQRLKKYHRPFEQIAGTADETKLRALFMMSFVHMYGIYGERKMAENNITDLLHGSEYLHCGTNTLFLAMLLDKAGYEFRTVSLGNGLHGFLEVKLDGRWQILDPTVDLWINQNTEDLLAGKERVNKQFFLKAADQFNEKAFQGAVKVINIQDTMIKLGQGYTPKVDKYNYIDLTQYHY